MIAAICYKCNMGCDYGSRHSDNVIVISPPKNTAFVGYSLSFADNFIWPILDFFANNQNFMSLNLYISIYYWRINPSLLGIASGKVIAFNTVCNSLK